MKEHLIAVQFSWDSSVDISTCTSTADARVSCPPVRLLAAYVGNRRPILSLLALSVCCPHSLPFTRLRQDPGVVLRVAGQEGKTEEPANRRINNAASRRDRHGRLRFYIYLWSARRGGRQLEHCFRVVWCGVVWLVARLVFEQSRAEREREGASSTRQQRWRAAGWRRWA